MIRVYYLETELVDGAEVVKGSEFIHHALLSIEGSLRKLLQDTTEAEHTGLITVAESWREATEDEAQQLANEEWGLEPEPPLVFAPLPGTGLPAQVENIKAFLQKAFPG